MERAPLSSWKRAVLFICTGSVPSWNFTRSSSGFGSTGGSSLYEKLGIQIVPPAELVTTGCTHSILPDGGSASRTSSASPSPRSGRKLSGADWRGEQSGPSVGATPDGGSGLGCGS